MINEDDDFYDMDKDDLATIIGLNKQQGGEDETLPMPILASGFDFDDYVPDFKKGRNFQMRGGKQEGPPQRREARYKSKRYGGAGDELEKEESELPKPEETEEQVQKNFNERRNNPEKGVPEGYSRFGKKYNRFAKDGERKL